MYKIYLFLLLSFIFFSTNSYAYDEDYDIKKEVCKTEDRSSCGYEKFSCTIKSISQDSDDFKVELEKSTGSKGLKRECTCIDKASYIIRTSYYQCKCQGNIPADMKNYEFNWLIFGTKKQTCNHFINLLYDNEYNYIHHFMAIDPDFITN